MLGGFPAGAYTVGTVLRGESRYGSHDAIWWLDTHPIITRYGRLGARLLWSEVGRWCPRDPPVKRQLTEDAK